MKIVKKVFVSCIFLFSVILFLSINWALNNFGNISIEEILFQLQVPMKGANVDYFYDYGIKVLLPASLIFIVFLILYLYKYKYKMSLEFTILKFNKKFNLNFIFRIPFYVLIIFAYSLFYGFRTYDVVDYIKAQVLVSNFIEDNYINPADVEIEFPENKRNLIFIYLESMETSYSDVESGGIQENNLIPNLTKLTKNNISFSSTNDLGGAYSTMGATWTIGAMVAHSAGIPLKLSINGNDYNLYEKFLPGVTSIGDILEENGYNQMLMVGSDADFAGRKSFYEQHGNYEIFDLNTAISTDKMSEEEKVWWGFEDQKLYTYAKEQITKLSKQKEPFNFTMLTVDTHSPDGYIDDVCKNKFDDQYSNVIYCADSQINSFIKWIQKQKFYKNTTVIVVGDHLTMSVNYNNKFGYSNKRATYNLFINSKIKDGEFNNRVFLTFDLFPTTLASLGATIEGDRLGLGTNLFSDKKTLTEELGYEYVQYELMKKSKYYDEKFILEK